MYSDLNDLQKKLVKMMAWFHKLCNDNGLKYYALGGTMLGAVRHHGFIPWDDDIDIGMPRNDYNKLITLIGNKVYDHYYLETPNSPYLKYKYPYSKLYDTDTTLIENTWPALKRGIFIDVFPLDGFGNTEKECMMNWKKVYNKSNFMWARTCSLRKERSIIKNTFIIFAHIIPNFIAKDKMRLDLMNKCAQIYSFESAKYGGNTFGNWGQKEIMETSIMGTPQLYSFENIEIYGVEDYDSYLTHMYGDWKKLPPEEKRITHHDFIKLDLNNSYLQVGGI